MKLTIEVKEEHITESTRRARTQDFQMWPCNCPIALAIVEQTKYDSAAVYPWCESYLYEGVLRENVMMPTEAAKFIDQFDRYAFKGKAEKPDPITFDLEVIDEEEE